MLANSNKLSAGVEHMRFQAYGSELLQRVIASLPAYTMTVTYNFSLNLLLLSSSAVRESVASNLGSSKSPL